MKNFIRLIINILLLPVKTFPLMWMWNWWIAPLGLNEINLTWAMGIYVFLVMLIYRYDGKQPNIGWTDFITTTLVLLMVSYFLAGISFIIHLI